MKKKMMLEKILYIATKVLKIYFEMEGKDKFVVGKSISDIDLDDILYKIIEMFITYV